MSYSYQNAGRSSRASETRQYKCCEMNKWNRTNIIYQCRELSVSEHWTQRLTLIADISSLQLENNYYNPIFTRIFNNVGRNSFTILTKNPSNTAHFISYEIIILLRYFHESNLFKCIITEWISKRLQFWCKFVFSIHKDQMYAFSK